MIAWKWYAVLLVEDFHLQVAAQGKAGPFALCEKRGKPAKPRIVECNVAAQKQQVDYGMTMVQALARCPNLQFLERQPHREEATQTMLLNLARKVSPFVEWTETGVVTLALPSEKKWTEHDLHMFFVQPLPTWNLTVGMAQNPDLALLAARFANPVKRVDSASDFLSPLPLTALQPETESLMVLKMWGIQSIGQLLALPQSEVCERLGADVLDLWERAQGNHARALCWTKEHERFFEKADLDHPVETLEPLLFLLRRFLETLVSRLAQVYRVPGELKLILHFEKGAPYEHLFEIPEPTGDISILLRTLHTHLEGFTSPWPIIGLEMEAMPVHPTSEQRDLFHNGLRDPGRFTETLARLQALLGSERAGWAQLESSHHPEAFHVSHDLKNQSDAGPNNLDQLKRNDFQKIEPPIGVPWLRFRPPIPASVELQNDRPIFLHSSESTAPIIESRGPWHREGLWWEARKWSSEEWDIELPGGLYRLVKSNGWWLEGIYQ